jgi:hypothetical protein
MPRDVHRRHRRTKLSGDDRHAGHRHRWKNWRWLQCERVWPLARRLRQNLRWQFSLTGQARRLRLRRKSLGRATNEKICSPPFDGHATSKLAAQPSASRHDARVPSRAESDERARTLFFVSRRPPSIPRAAAASAASMEFGGGRKRGAAAAAASTRRCGAAPLASRSGTEISRIRSKIIFHLGADAES